MRSSPLSGLGMLRPALVSGSQVTEANQVLDPQAEPVVQDYNEVSGNTSIETSIGDSSVTNQEQVKRVWSSLEESERVFLQENFDNRDYLDSALPVQKEVLDELSPVVETVVTNSEIPPEHLPEGGVKEKIVPVVNKKNLAIKGAIGIALLYILSQK